VKFISIKWIINTRPHLSFVLWAIVCLISASMAPKRNLILRTQHKGEWVPENLPLCNGDLMWNFIMLTQQPVSGVCKNFTICEIKPSPINFQHGDLMRKIFWWVRKRSFLWNFSFYTFRHSILRTKHYVNGSKELDLKKWRFHLKIQCVESAIGFRHAF